jgi:hypothetical protein
MIGAAPTLCSNKEPDPTGAITSLGLDSSLFIP